MLLSELKQTGILHLLYQIRDAYDSNDALRKETAAQYLAFLMTYRDFDYLFTQQNLQILPIEQFLKSGVDNSIIALQAFVNTIIDNKSIQKRVLKYTKRFLETDDGARYFKYQLTKVQDYFKQKHATNKTTASNI